jgi:MFS family permease
MVSTLISLFFVDKIGRRLLFLVGAAGMMGCNFLMGLLSLLNQAVIAQIVLIGIFLVFFESSIGPVLWIYGSEISTAKGMSIILLTNWIGSAFVGFTVPYLILPSALNLYGTFWLFAA